VQEKSAIVIELSGNMQQSSRIAWEILDEKLNIDYIKINSPCPHIALEYNFFHDNDSLFCYLEDIKGQCDPFIISALGLGVFIKKTPVIHIRWSMNNSFNIFINKIKEVLINANSNDIIEGYSPDDNWIPKTTLACFDTDYNNLNIALKYLEEIDFENELHIDTFALYKYSKQNGERKIKTFPI
jgi:hypothetical protein